MFKNSYLKKLLSRTIICSLEETWVNDLVVKQPAERREYRLQETQSLLVDVLINRCMFRSHLLYQFRRRR